MAGGAARGAAARVAAEAGAAEAGAARGAARATWPYELPTPGIPIRTPKQTAITSVAETERMNRALVNMRDFEKAYEVMAAEVETVGQTVKVSNPEEMKRIIWNGVLIRNPELAEYESPTLNPALYRIIDDYVTKTQETPQEIEKPVPLTTTPAVAQPQPEPVKFTVDTGIEGKKAQTEPEMQKQPVMDPLAQTIVISALGNVLSPKLAPLPQLSKNKQQPKTATETKQAKRPEEEREEDEEYLFEPKKPIKREVEKEVELDTEEDPLKQFLQKKSLGDYSSVFLLK